MEEASANTIKNPVAQRTQSIKDTAEAVDKIVVDKAIAERELASISETLRASGREVAQAKEWLSDLRSELEHTHQTKRDQIVEFENEAVQL